MSLPEHTKFRLELAEILANAVALRIRTKECEGDQQTYNPLAGYPIPDGISIDYAEKQQRLEVCMFIWTSIGNPVVGFFLVIYYLQCELRSIVDDLVGKYQETSLSILEHFYFPGDADDVMNYGRGLIDWISDIRKHLIQLKAETTMMLREKEINSEYELRVKDIYKSITRFEQLLKIKPKPPLPNPLVSPGRTSHPRPHDDTALTERLDRIRNTLTTFQTSRTEFSTSLLQIHHKYHLELFRPSLSSQFSNAIDQTVNSITSESLPLLLSTAKAGCQDALTRNEEAFHKYLGQQLHASFGLIQIVLGVTNAALSLGSEDGEIFDTY